MAATQHQRRIALCRHDGTALQNPPRTDFCGPEGSSGSATRLTEKLSLLPAASTGHRRVARHGSPSWPCAAAAAMQRGGNAAADRPFAAR